MTPRAGIYYPFEPYVGGGELYTFAVAEHLSRTHSVELLTAGTERVPEIASSMGYDLSRVQLRPRTGYIKPLEKALGSERYDLFVCVSNHAVPPVASLGKRGLLVVQFPFPTRRGDWVRTGLLGPLMLRSYRVAVVYSRFVAGWLRVRSPHPIETRVLAPPVESLSGNPDEPRDKVILGVGRFFEGQHSKRHDVLVEAFRGLVDGGLAGWELHLAGSVRPEPEHQSYLARVRALAEGYPVVIHTDIAQAHLHALYRRASVFWHATGYGTDGRAYPEAMEHFGIVTVEAMSAGCVPVVIARGGQPEIVQHGVSGFLWSTLDELKALTLQYAASDEAVKRAYRTEAIKAGQKYSPRNFRANLDDIVGDVMGQRGLAAEHTGSKQLTSG
ncbi:MAG TPA: glycosyltransferase family 4 protein [Chloroflexia bacterium]|nr:glycosyltransferase family 4 protein [Chloroflexia bacterium]